MRDIVRVVRDEIPPLPLPLPLPLPHSLRREVSPNPTEARYRYYIYDFERHNLPTFMAGFNVTIIEDWL